MLSENIKAIRKTKGLSQEELAVKLNVVRQTISKWEQGLSVPDSHMLISLSEALDTPVSVLLGEIVEPAEANDLLLLIYGSPYLGWDYSDPERAVVGVLLHAFEWFFVRLSPIVLVGAILGLCLVWKKA